MTSKPISGHTKYGWMLGLALFIFALIHDSLKDTWFLWLIWAYMWWRPPLLPNIEESGGTKLHILSGYLLTAVLCGFWGFTFHFLVYGKVW